MCSSVSQPSVASAPGSAVRGWNSMFAKSGRILISHPKELLHPAENFDGIAPQVDEFGDTLDAQLLRRLGIAGDQNRRLPFMRFQFREQCGRRFNILRIRTA